MMQEKREEEHVRNSKMELFGHQIRFGAQNSGDFIAEFIWVKISATVSLQEPSAIWMQLCWMFGTEPRGAVAHWLEPQPFQ